MSSINKTSKKTKTNKQKHAFKLDDLSEEVRTFTISSSSKNSLNHSSETTANNFLNNEVLANLLDNYKLKDSLLDDREFTDDDSGVNNSNYASLLAESEAFSIKHETDTPFKEEEGEVELTLLTEEPIETDHSESKKDDQGILN